VETWSGRKREGKARCFARKRESDGGWDGERKTTSPRAGGHAQLSDRSSERSVCDKEEDTTETRVASVLNSRYSSMRRAPTTDNLRHLHPATAKKKRKKRDRERDRKGGEKRKEGSVQCGILRRVLVGAARRWSRENTPWPLSLAPRGRL